MKIKQLKPYLMLWSTQALSTLGSGMTSYALVLWLYLRSGSALGTALLSVCSYAPYVVMSIFAGALSDRWNKKRTMLVCDLLAALSTVIVFISYQDRFPKRMASVCFECFKRTDEYNSAALPSEVAATLLIPKGYYQKTSGLRSFSQSLNSILTPILSTALFVFAGIDFVIVVDLITLHSAFITLLFIHIPENDVSKQTEEKLLTAPGKGVVWLRENPLILTLILYLACINLVASIYDAALPAMLLSKKNGGETVLGLVNTCVGIATLAGSVLVTFLPAPKIA